MNGNVVSYVAWGAAGQTMDLNVTSSDGSAILVVYGFQTGQWMVTYDQKKTSYSTTLPVSQDYIIVVDPTKGTVVNYTLTVGIH